MAGKKIDEIVAKLETVATYFTGAKSGVVRDIIAMVKELDVVDEPAAPLPPTTLAAAAPADIAPIGTHPAS